MLITDQITVVLKAREGERIADLAPFLKSGCTVLVGRSGAVVSAVSAGDKITHAEQLENQVLLAESAMRRGVQLPGAVDVGGSMHVDDRVKMIGGEPAYLTIVFKLPALNDAQSLIAQLPYGKKVLGTQAVVFGLTTGNLMEAEPCAN